MSSRYAIYLGSISALTLLALVATAPGCGPECSRASDCGAQQVCYSGTCENVQLTTNACDSDSDCNAEGSDLFECLGRRCILKNTGFVAPDAGMADASPMGNPDATMGGNPDAMTGNPDSGPADAGPGPGPDAGDQDGGPTPDGGPNPDGGPAPDGGPVGGGTLSVSINGQPATDFSGGGGPFSLYTPGSTVITGTDVANAGNSIEVVYASQDPATGTADCANGLPTNIRLVLNGTVYTAQGAATPTCNIMVTAYGDVAQQVVGVFTGSVDDGAGNVQTLTNGQFDVLRAQ